MAVCQFRLFALSKSCSPNSVCGVESMGSHPIALEAAANSHPPASLSTQTVTVYTRHQESCPKNGEPYWKRCHCMKYLYVYRENTSRQVSAKTRSWERAEDRHRKSAIRGVP